MPVVNAPGDGVAKVFCNAFYAGVVNLGRVVCKFGESGDGITNVRTGSHIGVEEFTKEFLIDEACVRLK